MDWDATFWGFIILICYLIISSFALFLMISRPIEQGQKAILGAVLLMLKVVFFLALGFLIVKVFSDQILSFTAGMALAAVGYLMLLVCYHHNFGFLRASSLKNRFQER